MRDIFPSSFQRRKYSKFHVILSLTNFKSSQRHVQSNVLYSTTSFGGDVFPEKYALQDSTIAFRPPSQKFSGGHTDISPLDLQALTTFLREKFIHPLMVMGSSRNILQRSTQFTSGIPGCLSLALFQKRGSPCQQNTGLPPTFFTRHSIILSSLGRRRSLEEGRASTFPRSPARSLSSPLPRATFARAPRRPRKKSTCPRRSSCLSEQKTVHPFVYWLFLPQRNALSGR